MTTNKLIVEQYATEIKGQNITFVPLPNRYLTLDEIGQVMKDSIDSIINHLKQQSEGHTVSHAVIIHPLVHLPFDDLNKDNPYWQEKLQSERN